MNKHAAEVRQSFKPKSTSSTHDYQSKSTKKPSSKKLSSLSKGSESKPIGSTEEANNGKAKIQYRNQMHIDDAIAYFEAIVAGLKKNKVEVSKEDKSIVLEPQEQLIVEVKASTKPERSKVSFKMSWNHLDQGSFSIK